MSSPSLPHLPRPNLLTNQHENLISHTRCQGQIVPDRMQIPLASVLFDLSLIKDHAVHYRAKFP